MIDPPVLYGAEPCNNGSTVRITYQDVKTAFEKLPGVEQAQREQIVQEHRRRSEEKLSALLKQVLDSNQQERLFQIELQQAGAFALLGPNDRFANLKITEEQRRQFMDVVQHLHQQVEPLMNAAQAAGNPGAIMPKVMQLRREHEKQIEAMLTEAQKEQWQKLLGKSFSLDD